MKRDYRSLLWVLIAFTYPLTAMACWIDSMTTSETSGMANAHLIKEPKDALLVYAGLTKSDAAKIADAVEKSGKNLTAIFVTDSQPEHFLALEVLQQRFPKARIVSTAAVAKEIQLNGPSMLAKWRKKLKEDAPAKLVVPTALAENKIMVEAMEVRVLDFKGGKTAHNAALYVPAIQALFTGDLVYNQVHMLSKHEPITGWTKNLDLAAKAGEVRTLYPGRGPNGDASTLGNMKKYLKDLNTAETLGDKGNTAQVMKQKYPTYGSGHSPEWKVVPASDVVQK